MDHRFGAAFPKPNWPGNILGLKYTGNTKGIWKITQQNEKNETYLCTEKLAYKMLKHTYSFSGLLPSCLYSIKLFG
jgi:tRNA A37 threonylcarbamoyltransferase TsaD